MARKTPVEINQEVEALIARKEADNDSAYSREELDLLLQYSGSGGKGVVAAGKVNQLYEFYTPLWLAEKMWELAHHHGYDGGPVLEPSCATGNLFVHAPAESVKVGFETNPTTAKIVKIRFPEANIIADYFETAFMEPPRFTTRLKKQVSWLKEYPFSLVIGNPPYGNYKSLFSSYFKKPNVQTVENFFMYYGLQLLREGGLVIYLTSSNFLRNGEKYNEAKKAMANYCDLVDAYRLPTVFSHSKVPTDILIFRRK